MILSFAILGCTDAVPEHAGFELADGPCADMLVGKDAETQEFWLICVRDYDDVGGDV